MIGTEARDKADEPISPEIRRRIELTVSVRDTDSITKVPGAGSVEMRDGNRVQLMHNGVVVEAGCYYGQWMTEIIERLRGHHEPQEEVAFDAIVGRLAADSPGAVMIELGCYWAYYSLWFKHAVPDARCILVEPAHEYLQVGLRNFQLNGDGAAVRGAVGRPYGNDVSAGGNNAATPMLTVHGLMDDHGLDRIDLLHCDTQGGELPMLQEAEPLLRAGRVRFIVVSTHHHSTTGDPLTHQRCLRLLQAAGAHVIAEHSVSESCSGDGLIAASMDPRDRDLSVQVTHVRSRDTLFGELEYELTDGMKRTSTREQARAWVGRIAQRAARIPRPRRG